MPASANHDTTPTHQVRRVRLRAHRAARRAYLRHGCLRHGCLRHACACATPACAMPATPRWPLPVPQCHCTRWLRAHTARRDCTCAGSDSSSNPCQVHMIEKREAPLDGSGDTNCTSLKMNDQHDAKLGPAMPVCDARRPPHDSLRYEPRLHPPYPNYTACSFNLADERHAARPLAERLAGAQRPNQTPHTIPCTLSPMHRLHRHHPSRRLPLRRLLRARCSRRRLPRRRLPRRRYRACRRYRARRRY